MNRSGKQYNLFCAFFPACGEPDAAAVIKQDPPVSGAFPWHLRTVAAVYPTGGRATDRKKEESQTNIFPGFRWLGRSSGSKIARDSLAGRSSTGLSYGIQQ